MFRKLSEVKAHLQLQHYNLLDACMFCDHCSELFVNRQSLDKHMFVHVEQVFQCNNCKKKFLTQKELEDHSNKAQKCKPKVGIANVNQDIFIFIHRVLKNILIFSQS